jgi:hypothetical protein
MMGSVRTDARSREIQPWPTGDGWRDVVTLDVEMQKRLNNVGRTFVQTDR